MPKRKEYESKKDGRKNNKRQRIRWRNTFATWDQMVVNTFDNTNANDPKIYITVNGNAGDWQYAYDNLKGLSDGLICQKQGQLLTISMIENSDQDSNEFLEHAKKYLKSEQWDNSLAKIRIEQQKRSTRWRDNQASWNEKVTYLIDTANQKIYLKITDEQAQDAAYVYRMLVTDLVDKVLQCQKINLADESILHLELRDKDSEELTDMAMIARQVLTRGGKIIENPQKQELITERQKRQQRKVSSSFKKSDSWWDENVILVLDQQKNKQPVVYVYPRDDREETTQYIYNVFYNKKTPLFTDPLIICAKNKVNGRTLLTIGMRNELTTMSAADLKSFLLEGLKGGCWLEDEERKEAVQIERSKRASLGNYLAVPWRDTEFTWNDMITYIFDEDKLDPTQSKIYVKVNGERDDFEYTYITFLRPNGNVSFGCLRDSPLECVREDGFLVLQLKDNAHLSGKMSLVDIVKRFVRGGVFVTDRNALQQEIRERQEKIQSEENNFWRETTEIWDNKIILIENNFDEKNPAIYVEINDAQLGDVDYAYNVITRCLRNTVLECEKDEDHITIWPQTPFEQPFSIKKIVQDNLPGGKFTANLEDLQKSIACRKPHRTQRWRSIHSTKSWHEKMMLTVDDTNPKRQRIYVTIRGDRGDVLFACRVLGTEFENTAVGYITKAGRIILQKRKNVDLPNKCTVRDIVEAKLAMREPEWNNSRILLSNIRMKLATAMRAERRMRYDTSQQHHKLPINWNEVVLKPVGDKLLVGATNGENNGRIFRAFSRDLQRSEKLRVGKIGSLKKGDSGKIAILLKDGVSLQENENIVDIAEKEHIRGGMYDDHADIDNVENWRFIRYKLKSDQTVKVTQVYPETYSGDKRLKQDMSRICQALNHDLRRTVLEAVQYSEKELEIRVRENSSIPLDKNIQVIMTENLRGGHWLVKGRPWPVKYGPKSVFDRVFEDLSDSDFEMSEEESNERSEENLEEYLDEVGNGSENELALDHQYLMENDFDHQEENVMQTNSDHQTESVASILANFADAETNADAVNASRQSPVYPNTRSQSFFKTTDANIKVRCLNGKWYLVAKDLLESNSFISRAKALLNRYWSERQSDIVTNNFVSGCGVEIKTSVINSHIMPPAQLLVALALASNQVDFAINNIRNHIDGEHKFDVQEKQYLINIISDYTEKLEQRMNIT